MCENVRKPYICDVCTGCGRCGKPASSMRVLDFSVQNLRQASSPCQEEKYIVAVDIGTTTIAMVLRSTKTGETLDSYTVVNPQRKYGVDVLSKITRAGEQGAREEMRQAVEGVLREGVRRFRSKCPRLDLMVVAANTTMVHLAFGLDVSGLGEAPFQAETLEEIHTAVEGIETVVFPGCDAFVGGDIVAGMYACGMDEREEITLFIDLGTNGEIALGNRNRIIATATAAAPAFEGGAANGVYGADLAAVTAALLEQGMMDATGLLEDTYFEKGIHAAGVTVTQKHIRNIQMAKGAIAAGIRILAKQYGITSYHQIDRVWLAGGFGYYLNPQAAVRIGLIPAELEEEIYAVGNSALEGAFLYGKSRLQGGEGEAVLNDLRKVTSVINLAKQPEFQNLYLEALNFPAE